jgi:hypothetical protein
MKKWMLLGVLALAPAALAQQVAAPTDDTIRELLEVTEMRKMLDEAAIQMSKLYDQAYVSASGDEPTAAEHARVERSKDRMKKLLEEEMSWEVMAPIYGEVYRQSFTDEELKALVAFYKSPTGKTLIAKQPLVLQNLMKAMQSRVEVIMPRIQKEIDEEHKVLTPPLKVERH